MSLSKIEWTDRTWNPVTGCTKVSQGCKNCYAERIYERFHGHGSFKQVICHEDKLSNPISWKQPSMVFVNSMSDLFHEDVPFLFINAVFSVMSDISRHTYQVLTKRPQRMIDFFEWKKEQAMGITWHPSANVWIGVSVEDQKSADERIPLLLQVPASIRFLSCEPLIGEVDIIKYEELGKLAGYGSDIGWVIVGGESGPGARPMHPDWVKSLKDQCEVVDIPFFFKQWGEYVPGSDYASKIRYVTLGNDGKELTQYMPSSQDWNNLHPTVMRKAGKRRSGRMLDGVEYSNFPVTGL